jgi:hypothetical protein
MYYKIEKENFRRDIFVLTILILLAFISRIYGISDWSFIGDEYPTVIYAAERIDSLVNPAYYVLVLGSFKLFGVTEWSARLPAFLLGVASIPIFYITWRKVFGQNVALIGSLLIIFNSWHLFYSQFSRFYTGVFLFGSVTYYFYYKAIHSDNLKYLIWGLTANLTAILFHITSVLIASSFAVFCVIFLFFRSTLASQHPKRIAIIFLAIAAIGCILVTPFLWDSLTERGQLAIGATGPMRLFMQLVRDFQLPIAISGLFGLILLINKDSMQGVFIAVNIGIPLLIILLGSMVAAISSRYIFYISPLVFILAAFLCDQTWQSLKSIHSYKFVSHVMTIVIIFCMLPQTVSQYVGRNSLDFREAVKFVEKNYQPGDRVLSYVQGGQYGFNRYSKKNYTLESRYGGNPYHNSVDWEQTLKNYENEQQRMWILLNVWRRPLVRDFETWLMTNASLVWRKYENRYDGHVQGYEVWLMNGDLSNNGAVAEVGL